MSDEKKEEAIEALRDHVTNEITNGVVHLDGHDGLLNATRAVMVGVASGAISDKSGSVLISGVRTALAILESKKKANPVMNPARFDSSSVTPDGPFGFKKAE